MSGQALRSQCLQFNSSCWNEQVCLVLLLEAQPLVFRGYQGLTFPARKWCLQSSWNISIVKLLVQIPLWLKWTLLQPVRLTFKWIPFISLIKNVDYSKSSSITDRCSAIISWLAGPVWRWIAYKKHISHMETASHSSCPLEVNSGFSNSA